jgi:4-amino-4-deoxy-L-arabinose transferase-like glycosyltransferase
MTDDTDSQSRLLGRLPGWAYILALVAICLVSRLPQLRSPNLLADGDECVLGLMAKHVAQGKEFPIFFYGQHYAFSPVETVVTATSFLIAGVGAVPLKVAGLVLWTVGLVFLFLALSRLLTASRSFWIAVLVVLNPAWAVWSLRMGGGYLTAFAASSILVWLILRDHEHDNVWRWLAAGALTAVIYLAQPLWLPGVLPVVAVVLLSRRRLPWALGYLSVAAATTLLIKFGTATPDMAWNGPAVGNPSLIASLPDVGRQIYQTLTGSYYLYWAIDPPGRATTALAIVWCVVLPAVLLLQTYRMLSGRRSFASLLLLVSVAVTLVTEWLLFSVRDARYLLPLSGLLVPLAGIELLDLADRRLVPRSLVLFLTTTMVVLGSLSVWEFKDFNFLWTNPAQHWSESKRLQQVFNYLYTKDVRRVFSKNGMLDTQLMLYSDERILSRSDPLGKYPPYVKEVDRALTAGETVAVVGYTNQSGAPGCWDVPICTAGIERIVPNPEAIFVVDDKYFVYVGADKELLTKLGFRFWD